MIDVQALLKSAFKNMRVLSMAVDEDGSIDALLVDAGGEVRSLTVSAPIVKEAPRETVEPTKEMQAPRPVQIIPSAPKPSASEAVYEERRQAARAGGTTMAKKPDFSATFQIIHKADDALSSEAKKLFGELEHAELRAGDDDLLLSVARAARGGNEAPLRDLVERRRKPSATAPP